MRLFQCTSLANPMIHAPTTFFLNKASHLRCTPASPLAFAGAGLLFLHPRRLCRRRLLLLILPPAPLLLPPALHVLPALPADHISQGQLRIQLLYLLLEALQLAAALRLSLLRLSLHSNGSAYEQQKSKGKSTRRNPQQEEGDAAAGSPRTCACSAAAAASSRALASATHSCNAATCSAACSAALFCSEQAKQQGYWVWYVQRRLKSRVLVRHQPAVCVTPRLAPAPTWPMVPALPKRASARSRGGTWKDAPLTTPLGWMRRPSRVRMVPVPVRSFCGR